MKHVILFSLLSAGMLTANNPLADIGKSNSLPNVTTVAAGNNEAFNIGTQEPDKVRITAISFRNQEYCRAELKDFDFDFSFTVVSATVYFSGANFPNVEKRSIKSNSLKELTNEMKRCIPGTIVSFDDVKVVGSDKSMRTIAGKTFVLY